MLESARKGGVAKREQTNPGEDARFLSSVSSQSSEKRYLGGFGPGVPPLPIPNREVKPGRADGTAPQCGRVGRRLLEERRFQELS